MNQSSTPFNERFYKISQRLNSISFTQDSSKAHRIENICQRVTFIEERLIDTTNSYNRKIVRQFMLKLFKQSLKDEIVRLQKIIEEENAAFDQAFDTRNREIQAIENRIAQRIEQEINARKDGNSKIQGYLDEKSVYLRADIQTDSKIRTEQIENITASLENDLPKLFEMVQNERTDREEQDNNLLKRAGDEIRRLNDSIGGQKKLREESESAIFEMLKDLVSRVKSEIEEEKKQREQSEESLLNLLEEACNKMYKAAKE